MPQCPWDGFRPAVMQFCEASRCALVAQPGNTWSSAAYALAAVALVLSAPPKRRATSAAFALAALAVGAGSALYHATNAYAFELVDLASMYALSCLLVVQSLRLPRGRAFAAYAVLLAGSVAAVLLSIAWGDALFGGEIAVAMAIELKPAWRARRVPPTLALAGAAFGAAYAAWNLDYYRVACDPGNAANGHALWHVLTAAAFFALGVHYRRDRA